MAFIAMNNFQVAAEHAAAFEARWQRRRSYLKGVPGFLHFQLLRGETRDGQVHYISHSTWESREAFEAWTRSERFVQAHRGEPLPRGMVVAPPRLETFQVVPLDEVDEP
ncbi:MAG: antibiotic biosynthesis monooxygenase [Candidatus Tectimicrobiota bacterium]|nr:MAG: antibiotic biosynthesis monooxygenase [Candidatus Tectomicrobia bacterium]